MGKRRIRNFLKLGYNDLIGFDSREDRRKEVSKKHGIKIFSDLKSAFNEKPNVMIISTPPDLHLKFAKMAIEKKIDFFTELNLISNDVMQIIEKMKKKSVIGLPSCTMRFHPVVKELKRILEKKTIGKILIIQHHAGHFLPNWHPWEDYRKFFVAKKQTGGAREIVPIELMWLTHLFCEIKSVIGNVKKISSLDVKIDDVYQILIHFKNNILCSLVIDVLSIPAFKETKIIGEKGTILCDFNSGIIKINNGSSWVTKKVKINKVAKGYKGNTPSESVYEDEIKLFMNTIKGKAHYPQSFRDELKILKILDLIETSSKTGKKIKIN